MIRFIHGLSTCQSCVLVNLFFLVGLWCLRQQRQKDLGRTAQLVLWCESGETSATKDLHRPATRRCNFRLLGHHWYHWRVKIGSAWIVMIVDPHSWMVRTCTNMDLKATDFESPLVPRFCAIITILNGFVATSFNVVPLGCWNHGNPDPIKWAINKYPWLRCVYRGLFTYITVY